MSNITVISIENKRTYSQLWKKTSQTGTKDQLAPNRLNCLEFYHDSLPTISLKRNFEVSDYPNFSLKTFDVCVMQSLKKNTFFLMLEKNQKKVCKKLSIPEII